MLASLPRRNTNPILNERCNRVEACLRAEHQSAASGGGEVWLDTPGLARRSHRCLPGGHEPLAPPPPDAANKQKWCEQVADAIAVLAVTPKDANGFAGDAAIHFGAVDAVDALDADAIWNGTDDEDFNKW